MGNNVTLTELQPEVLPSPEVIAEQILEGFTYRQMAVIHGIGIGKFFYLINKDDYKSIIQTALLQAADMDVERAMEVLEELPSNATRADIARARELSNKLIWRASKRCPRVYGDRIELEHSGSIADAALGILEARKRYQLMRNDPTQPVIECKPIPQDQAKTGDNE